MNMLAQIGNNINQVTMTSLEIVDFINKHRKFDANPVQLRHADFMAKVPKVLGFELSEKFRSVYKDGTGRTLPCCHFQKREACLMAMSYSYELQAQIFDRMTAMEEALKTKTPQSFSEALQLAADQARQLEIAAPKVQYFDAVVERSTLLNATQVAQKLRMSAMAMNKLLDALDVYSHGVKRARVFKQWFIDKGLGELKQTDLGYSQPMFTTRGEAWVIERLVSEGVVS